MKKLNSICSSCGERFECQIKSGGQKCWCFDYPAVEIKAGDKNCLCPNCLKKQATVKQP